MCGIAGILNFNNAPIDQTTLATLCSTIEHRGPDDHGFLVYDTKNGAFDIGREQKSLKPGNMALIHRRLSIVDLTDAGWQPMSSDDGSIAVVYNGEIYNYVEIAKELTTKGHKFNSTGDTAVLIAAYREWGVDCLNKFIGMFSFALLDTKRNILFCARDFFGIKPFYYSCNDNEFIFGSEQKALIATGRTGKRANAAMLHDYIAYGEQEGGTNSFYYDIAQLPPAHYLVIDLSKKGPQAISARKYWNVHANGDSGLTRQEASEKLKALFLQSVSMHMRSDVAIAANLSGGIDSSSIVMAMRQSGGQSLDLHTISYIADYARVSEEKWIDIINNASGAIPHKVAPKAADLAIELDTLIKAQDEPFGSTSPYAQYKVFEAINNEGIKVVLDGQGADELLAGYTSYIFPRIRTLLDQKQYLQAFLLIKNANLLGQTMANRLPIVDIATKIRNKLLRTSGTQLRQHPSIIHDDFIALALADRPAKNIPQARQKTPNNLLDVLHTTFTESSLPHLLRVADRNSMHFSVESRLPFLTPEIAELIFSLPEEYIIDDTALTKSVFRKSMTGMVPQQILDRRDKIGFSTPEKEWLLSLDEWVSDLFSSDFAKHNPVLNHKTLIQEWQDLKDGKTGFDWRFWRRINLLRWMEINQIEIGS